MDVQRVLDEAVALGVTPGAAAVIATAGGARAAFVSGRLHREPDAAAVDEDTIWDLASLTKLLSTTVLTAQAIDAGALALDETPWSAWPGVSIEHVLRHSAGLAAWRPLFQEAFQGEPGLRTAAGLTRAQQLVVDAARATVPEATPGARTLYSDMGMIALGALLEARLALPLDEAFAAAAAHLYGPNELRFVRIARDGFHPQLMRVAATERCAWRRRVVHGQVHDENCFAMGGVGGHAGLFGSVRDVERAGLALLRAGGTLRRFAAVPADPQARPIGFDRTTPGGSTGDALSPEAVGHLGFTGCSLWIDARAPQGGAVLVLLTNRICEVRGALAGIRQLRVDFHRAAATLLRSTQFPSH